MITNLLPSWFIVFCLMFSLVLPLVYAVSFVRSHKRRPAYFFLGVFFIGVSCLLIMSLGLHNNAARFATLCRQTHGTVTTEDFSYICQNSSSETNSMESSSLNMGIAGNLAFLANLGVLGVGITSSIYLFTTFCTRVREGTPIKK